MRLIVKPFLVINRGGERAVANAKGFIDTDNKEIIEVANRLYPVKIVEKIVEKKIITKTTVGKSKAGK